MKLSPARPLLRPAAALAVAWLVALPAHAALFDDEEARRRIEATNQRLGQVQKQLDDRIAALEAQLRSQGLVELFSAVEQIKADIARLRGQIEVLNYDLEQAQKRQRDLYVDLDTRLRKLEGGPGATTPPAAGAGLPPSAGAPVAQPPAGLPASGVAGTLPPPGPASGAAAGAAAGAAPVAGRPAAGAADPANEQRTYDASLDQFKSGNYAAAVAGFASFVKAYPKSPLAPSAQYWIGNAQSALKDYRAAIASQRQLIAAYPDSLKVADALLNIATCQFDLGEAAASRRTLEELVAKYPQSDAAAKARQRLATR